MTTTEALVSDAIAAALGGWTTYKLFDGVIANPHKLLAVTLTGAGVVAGAVGYTQERLSTSTDPRNKWMENNQISFIILSGSYMAVFLGAGEFFLFEFMIIPGVEKLLILTAAGYGSYLAWLTGPTIGSMGQMMIWGVATALGLDLPEPNAIASAQGISHLPTVAYDTMRDIFTKGIWEDTIKAMVDDLQEANAGGLDGRVAMIEGAARIAFFPIILLANVELQVLNGFTKATASILHTIIKKTS